MPNGCGDEVSGHNFVTYTGINSDGNSKAHNAIMQFGALRMPVILATIIKIYKRQIKNITAEEQTL